MPRSELKCSNSYVYGRIQALPLSATERALAVTALRDGEAIADAILWAASAIKHLFHTATLKPALRH